MPEVPPVSRALGVAAPRPARQADDPAAAVGLVFSNEGPLARALADYEPRDGQRRMAHEVARVLDEGGVLLAEAGTGTGKTMAYLVPAILSGRRVLVSTGTKNLQEQIYFKDLPALAAALSLEIKACYMKGRSNYLCRHRLDQARTSLAPGLLDSIAAWAETSETGDRAELHDLSDDSGIWNEISATAETCLGTDCPQHQQCFVTLMRQRAAESDIVVVNHHLLCADAAVRQSSYGEVIPEIANLVIDEAHQLEDVATQYFGISVSNYRLDEIVRDSERVVRAGEVGDPLGDVSRAIARVDEHARAFFGGIAMARRLHGRQDERLRIGPDWFGDVVEDALALTTALSGLEAVMSLAGAGDSAARRESNEDALTLGRRAREIRDDLQFMLAASDRRFVYFVETRGRGTFLRAAPIDVAAIVQEHLFERMRSTVLTSATLAVDRSFAYVRGRLGITSARELSVPSEFDFTRQSLLFLPRRMPSPKSPQFLEAAADCVRALLRATHGRAFVLFTSYAALRGVHERLMGAVPFPLLVQGASPRAALLARFRTTPNAVLLATSSFWQGVDVVGEQLSCVIVDKLPFASPGDPIIAARIEAIGAEGGDAFNDYQVPLAVLSLLQGLGRLIRHRNDRGVLAVLDPRLRTMAYGRRFLDALPPSPTTHDLDDVERFFS